MREFTNLETSAIFFDVISDCLKENPADPLGTMRAWLDMCGDSAAEQLAKRLRKDMRANYGAIGPQNTMVILLQSGLRRVNFRQIAKELIRLCQPQEVEAEGEDDPED